MSSSASGWNSTDGTTYAYTVPSWNNPGDNGWQLTAASLVGLQCIVGLPMIYGGLSPRKWALNSAFMATYAYAVTLMWWPILLYNEGFGNQAAPFFGVPKPVITLDALLSQAVLPAANVTANFPMATMMYFQSVFAAITVIIIAGALVGRMSFKAWMIFCPLWLLFSYGVGAFSIWAGGFLFQRGVLDYSGGLVIHCSSGTAGFIAAKVIGPRHPTDRRSFRPSNLVLALAGTGILWIGWNGFNGGDPYAATPAAGVAVLNTNVATATSMLTWMMLDVIFFKKPSIIGAIQGVITGLVAITPAGSFVDGWAAIIIGALSGSIPWVTMNVLGKQTWFLAFSDDALGVFHTHLVASFVGNFCTGLFAKREGVAAFASTGAGGVVSGNSVQLGWQMAGFCFVCGWNLVVTPLILYFIKYVLRVPLRLNEQELLIGDDAVHGEAAYTFVDEAQLELLYHKYGRAPEHDHDMEAGTSHVTHDRKEQDQVYNGSLGKARNGELREVASE